MYRFEVTKDMAQDLARFEELRGAFDADAFLARTWSGRMRRELESEAIGASVSMEGVPVTVDEVRRILAGDRPETVSKEDAALVVGYRQAMTMVLHRADDPSFTWQSELMKGIHERVLAGSWANGAGRYRESQNRVVNDATGAEVYLPPPPEEVPDLVDGLVRWLASSAGTTPPPVAAAVAHARLAGIHPFRDGNGRTARILASLVMYRAGYKLPQFTSLEEWWGGHQADYYAAFAALGKEWAESADITPFVAAHVRAQKTQAESLSLRLSTERLLWTALEEVARDGSADARTANALYDAVMGRAVTNQYYRNVVDVTAPTAASDLARLGAAGLLARSGAGRSTAYHGTVTLFERVAEVSGVQIDARGAQSPDEALRNDLMVALATRAQSGTGRQAS